MTKLISFPTVSRDTNLPLVEWVRRTIWTAPTGSEIASLAWIRINRTRPPYLPMSDPWEEGAVVLSGHTDVVPVDGQPWDTDPFVVTEKDGKYFGRGTCDMKGFRCIGHLGFGRGAIMQRCFKRPLQLALSFDEEIGCTGAPPMIVAMQDVLPKGSAVDRWRTFDDAGGDWP